MRRIPLSEADWNLFIETSLLESPAVVIIPSPG
jgi:hypothetical protein